MHSCVLRKSTMCPELFSSFGKWFQNETPLRFPTLIFFKTAVVTGQCSLPSTTPIAGVCQQILQVEDCLQYSLPEAIACSRNFSIIQTKQGKHNMGIRKLSTLKAKILRRAYGCNSSPFFLRPEGVCLLLCLVLVFFSFCLVQRAWTGSDRLLFYS